VSEGITAAEPWIEFQKIELAIPLQEITVHIPPVRQSGSNLGNYLLERLRSHRYRLVGFTGPHGKLLLGGEANKTLLLAIQDIHAVFRPLDDFLNNHRILSPQRRQRTFRHGLPAGFKASFQISLGVNHIQTDRRTAPARLDNQRKLNAAKLQRINSTRYRQKGFRSRHTDFLSKLEGTPLVCTHFQRLHWRHI